METKTQRVRALLAKPIAWPCPVTAVEAIALEEDCRLRAYLDIARVPTCGWGETDGVRLGDVWSQEYADERFQRSLGEWSRSLRLMLQGAPTTESQFSAMLSMMYNVGIEPFRGSTVLRCHVKGDYQGAARAFALWNNVRKNGKLEPNDVLTARRAREAAMYLSMDDEQDEPKGVQAVGPESKLSQSPIMVGGAASTGVGIVAMGKEVLDGFVGVTQKAQEVAGAFSVSPIVVLALVAVAVGLTSMYWRWKQRQGGWA